MWVKGVHVIMVNRSGSDLEDLAAAPVAWPFCASVCLIWQLAVWVGVNCAHFQSCRRLGTEAAQGFWQRCKH